MIKLLFMGTPDFAADILAELIPRYEICGVMTKPDKEQDRGMKPTFSPVKKLALSNGIAVYQPETLKNLAVMPLLDELAPDIIVVAAYGKILPEYVLNYPRLGCINVHGSLLPKYRGAAPIQRSIIDGEKETGVTIMHMAKGIDTGDMILSRSIQIEPFDTSGSLTPKLSKLGAELLLEALTLIEEGKAPRIVQDEMLATYAHMLTREDGIIDWSKNAEQISALIRGCDPWPTAGAVIDGVSLKLFSPKVSEETTEETPGTVVFAGKKGLGIVCGEGSILIVGELHPVGKKRMNASAYFNGHPIKEKIVR